MKPWTDAQIIELKKLASTPRSAAEIGEIIGRTRNSVIGKCYREGIEITGNSVKVKPSKRKPKKERRKKENPYTEPVSLCIHLSELRKGQCKWTLDGFHYCGHAAIGLFCPYHTWRGTQKPWTQGA